MTLAGKLVDANALLNVVWASLVAGVGATAAFSFAIVGATRFVDMRRSGRELEAWMFAAVGAIGLAICLGAIVLGIWEIVNK
jgi:hypothetical protein